MNKLFLLIALFPLYTFGQEKIGSYNDSSTTTGCKYLSVLKIRIIKDQIEKQKFGSIDSCNLLAITLKNNCRKCEIIGPDYSPIIVNDESGKVIGQSTINIIPANRQKRVYYVQCVDNYKFIDQLPSKLKISLINYCVDMRWSK